MTEKQTAPINIADIAHEDRVKPDDVSGWDWLAVAHRKEYVKAVKGRDQHKAAAEAAWGRENGIRQAHMQVVDAVSEPSERERVRDAMVAEADGENQQMHEHDKAATRADKDRKANVYDAREHTNKYAMGYKVAAIVDAHDHGVNVQLGPNEFDQTAQVQAQEAIAARQNPAA